MQADKNSVVGYAAVGSDHFDTLIIRIGWYLAETGNSKYPRKVKTRGFQTFSIGNIRI